MPRCTAIRYPLRWHHLAVVIWYPDRVPDGDELARLQRFLRELSQVADADANPLFVAADRISGWAWLPFRGTAPDAIASVRRFAQKQDPTRPVSRSARMASGVDGFRRSHRAAEAARDVAIGGGQHEQTIIAATDPGLSAAALLASDIGEAREWVDRGAR